MMQAFGVGTFVKDPELVNVGSTVKTNFVLVYTETFIKTSGEKIKTSHYLEFEAWDSAARHIVKCCKKGDKIAVFASPRQERWEKDGQRRQRIIFRINKFELIEHENEESDTLTLEY